MNRHTCSFDHPKKCFKFCGCKKGDNCQFFHNESRDRARLESANSSRRRSNSQSHSYRDENPQETSAANAANAANTSNPSFLEVK